MEQTIRVDEFSYALIKAFKDSLEEVMPTNVSLGTAAALGAIFGLGESVKMKVKLMKTPKGQMYLKIIDALKQVQTQNETSTF